jgi:hypothetical protein
MERARATWTDERLDDLSRRMDNGFNRVDEDLRDLSQRFDALQRFMVQIFGGTTLGILATIVTVLLTRP